MSSFVKRLRMFAGPNGSGKSSLKLKLSPELLQTYINPDEIPGWAKVALRETFVEGGLFFISVLDHCLL